MVSMHYLSAIIYYISSPLYWLTFFFGLLLGSFLNVCIYRIPRNIFWQSWRSFCFNCHNTIPFYLNIPIISFFLLRRKSKCCQQKIPWQYPIVELLAGISLVLIYHIYGFVSLSSDYQISIYSHNAKLFAHVLVFTYLLIICSFIDLEFKIIPDSISLTMIALSPAVVFFHPLLTWQNSLLGVIIGAGVIYLIAWIYYLIRKQEGIGMGDAKLLAAIGGWLGWQAIFPTLLYSSILGSIVGILISTKQKGKLLQIEVPFGPFLSIAALWHLLAPSKYLF
jgi:leader peptidase (prepilin peptidase) / N-methyltransferase